MNDADAQSLLRRYAKPWFVDKDATGWFERAPEISSRVAKGTNVPILTGREMTAAMIFNVENSRTDVEGTRDRLREAQRDGMFDADVFAGTSRKTRQAWVTVAGMLRGDYCRAVAELKHWEDYAESSAKGELPVLKRTRARVDAVVADLARSKDVQPAPPEMEQDPRLPPEKEDVIPF